MKHSAFWSATLAVLVCSACTQQQPAEIVYKGSQFFGREHERAIDSADNETFDRNSPRYKPGYVRPAEPAEVPSVAVSELPPPSASKHVTKIQEQSPSSGSKSHVLNLAAQKHEDAAAEEEQQVADISQEDAPVVHKASTGDKPSRFIWPVEGGKVLSHFDANKKGNDGINIAMAEGEPIFAAADGTVVYAGNELKGYGNMVIIRHADGWMTAYAHARNLAVKKGDKVKQNGLIAYVGSTGDVKKPQVHFVLRKDKTPVNPEAYLPHAAG